MTAFAAAQGHAQDRPDPLSYELRRETLSVSFTLAGGQRVDRTFAYEIAQKSEPLPDGTILIRSEGRLESPSAEDLAGSHLSYEGTYQSIEIRKAGEPASRTGQRTLHILHKQSGEVPPEGPSFQRIHDYEYTIDGDIEYRTLHREREIRAHWDYFDHVPSQNAQDDAQKKGLKKTHALIREISRTYDREGRLIGLIRDTQTRESLFEAHGHIVSDTVENTFSSEDALKPDAKIETRYRRDTEYGATRLPQSVKTTQNTVTREQSRTMRSSLRWSALGDLELARVEEFDGRKMIADKIWQKKRPSRAPASELKNTLTDTGLVRLTKFIRNWEETFVNGGLPVSPYAFPFFVL
ncbi:MAG: hypothetical protein WC352_02400 [Candidatus Omnitrophota bacterium]|jgi:hypothetical protein